MTYIALVRPFCSAWSEAMWQSLYKILISIYRLALSKLTFTSNQISSCRSKPCQYSNNAICRTPKPISCGNSSPAEMKLTSFIMSQINAFDTMSSAIGSCTAGSFDGRIYPACEMCSPAYRHIDRSVVSNLVFVLFITGIEVSTFRLNFRKLITHRHLTFLVDKCSKKQLDVPSWKWSA